MLPVSRCGWRKGDRLVEMLRIRVHARDNKHNELMRTFQLIIDQAAREKGCTDCHLSRDSENGIIFTMQQHWQRWSLLNIFLGSEHFQALLGAMKSLSQTYVIEITDSKHRERRDSLI